MTREEIIDGLKFTVGMFLFDPLTGETITEPRNDMDKITIDACRGAIELLEQEPCEDAISRQAVKDTIFTECSGTKLDIDFAKVLLLQRAIKALPSATLKCRCSEKPDKWHKEPPKKDGRYLVWWYDRVEIANYTDNLYKVDWCNFKGKERAGWYNYDDEYGCYELEDVLGWQELPSDYAVEIGELADVIKEKSKADFIALCAKSEE